MITIIPYQQIWPEQFTQLARALRAALGPLALRIDHIGSTAVPGLIAKDIIDIQLTAPALTPELESALHQIGYRRIPHITQDHLPPGAKDDPHDWTKWFFKPPAGSRPVHLHVRLSGRPNQRYPLLSRDYLRAHPAAAAAYGQVKLALARHHPNDIEAFCDIKDPVCDILLAAAETWAASTHWQPGPSDE